MLKNQLDYYGSVSKCLHWLIAILFTLQIGMGVFMMNIQNKPLKMQIFMLHKSDGLLILLLVILFLCWSLINIKPALPLDTPTWERMTARLNHGLLYTFLLLMGLSGWLLSTASGHAPSFFGLFTIPMPGIGKNEAVSDWGSFIHYWGAWIICGLVLIHIAAALRHHFIKRNQILLRMLPKL